MSVAVPQPGVDGSVRLEPMRWWQVPEVHALEVALFPEQPWTITQFWSELARVPESRWYVVALLDGRIVGYAGLFVVGAEADVQTVAVAPDAQGRGIGTTLVRALQERARIRGARVLHLEVRADNARALAVYARLGFATVGRRRDYYGRGSDAVLMSAPLDPAAQGEGHG